MKTKNGRVYDFAYLDAEVAADYLGAIAGPVATPTHGTDREGGKRGGKAGVAVGPLEVGGEVGKEDSHETHYELRQAQSAMFYKLREHLQSGGLLSIMDEFNQGMWSDLSEGEFVEVRGRVEVSPLDSFLNLVSEMYELGTSVGVIDPSDESTKQNVAVISMLTQSGGKGLSIFVYPSGSSGSRYRFFSSLNRTKLHVPMDELNARFRVLGRIRTVLEGNEVVDLLRLPGNIRLPRDQFREFVKGFKDAPFLDRQLRPSDLKVTAPAIEITTVAIFR